MDHVLSGLRLALGLLHRLSIGVVVAITVALSAYTALSAFGSANWLEISLRFGEQPLENAGIWLQVAVTAIMLMLMLYLPSNTRILSLENSHRRFQMNMKDVARAYQIAHSADRSGLFMMDSEYDSVRERLSHLRNHPDLEQLEPEILELAAQMSHISQDLAETYSDEAVSRARSFLRQRQSEISKFDARLQKVGKITKELKKWNQTIEMEEDAAAAQLERLRDELSAILPELSGGRIVEFARESDRPMPMARAAE